MCRRVRGEERDRGYVCRSVRCGERERGHVCTRVGDGERDLGAGVQEGEGRGEGLG